jgi:hypothetical protein
MDTQNIQIIYKTYSEAQKKAILKWRNGNKDKVNALAKKYYDNIKTNPEYIQRKREIAKKHYQKKKELLSKANLQEMYNFLEKKIE